MRSGKVLKSQTLISIIIYGVLVLVLIHRTNVINFIDVRLHPRNASIISADRQIQLDDMIDFEEFDNQQYKNDSHSFIVPDIVHLIFINTSTIQFYQAINIFSIYLNHNPAHIYIHCDLCNFTGYFWDRLNSLEDLKSKLVLKKVPNYKTIYGVKYGWIQHRFENILSHFKINFHFMSPLQAI